MMKMDMAPCGLDCNTCNLYKAAHDLQAAEALVDWFRDRGWIEKSEGAEAIQRKAPFCKGCRTKEEPCWCGDCFMRDCCNEKGHDDCGVCSSFPCAKYLEWTVDTPHHQEAMVCLMEWKKNRPY